MISTLNRSSVTKIALVLICTFFKTGYVFCQAPPPPQLVKPEYHFPQQDIGDWLARLRKKPPPAEKNSFLIIIPWVSSNPTAGFIVGMGLSFAYKKNKTDQYLSVVTGSASYSTNKQVSTSLKTNMYIAKGKVNLNGDWRYLINNETTYGLGTDKFHNKGVVTNGVPTEEDTTGQSLRYNQVRFYETASLKLFKNFFAGMGFHYDNYFNIIDHTLEKGDTGVSIHHKYSNDNGFSSQKYTTSGVSLNFLFDGRDNQVNAYTGYYFNVNYRVNLTALGSTENSTSLITEYRSFHPLDPEMKRHILAFWYYGSYVISGNMPYLALPALGYDQQQRTGRGYKFGQFRGNSLVYGESEYRFPISRNTGILAGDVFLNITSTSDRNTGVKIFNYLRPGFGGGLRIMLDKQSRTRLAIDVGASPGSAGFYFGAQETF
jgi:hypothetical protein